MEVNGQITVQRSNQSFIVTINTSSNAMVNTGIQYHISLAFQKTWGLRTFIYKSSIKEKYENMKGIVAFCRSFSSLPDRLR